MRKTTDAAELKIVVRSVADGELAELTSDEIEVVSGGILTGHVVETWFGKGYIVGGELVVLYTKDGKKVG